MQSARFDGERVASQLNGASWFFQTRLHSNVLSRLKSGPDYTRLPLIAMGKYEIRAWADSRRTIRFGAAAGPWQRYFG